MNWFELAKTYPLQDFLESAYGLEFKKSKCLCPFHADRNPSLNVVTKKEPHYFNCVVCGAAGDIVKFVEKMDNLAPADAAKKVLLHYGVDVGKPMSAEEAKEAEAEQKKRLELIASSREKKNKKADADKAKVVKELTAATPKLLQNMKEAFEHNNEKVISYVLERFPNIYNNLKICNAYLGWDYDQDTLVIINRRINGNTFNFKHHTKKNHKGEQYEGKWISMPNSTTEVFGLDFLQPEGPVFVCEGEKDCINLLLLGLNAITLGGVSNKWEPFASVLEGRDVIVWYDNDKAGYVNTLFATKDIEKVAHSAVTCMFYTLVTAVNKYDVSDYLVNKVVDSDSVLLENIAYSCFAVNNRLIEEVVARYEWKSKGDGALLEKINALKTVDKLTTFDENIEAICKHIQPVRGEKDHMVAKINQLQKELTSATNAEKISKFANSLFLEDQDAFFETIKDFKSFVKTKKEILDDFRQTHIFDIYDGLFRAVTTAGFDFWKFRGKIYFWTGSYFCMVIPWEMEDFIYNKFMVLGEVEKKKRLSRNKKEVLENVYDRATPMERYVKDDSRVVNLLNGVLVIRKSGNVVFRNHHKKTDCATNMLSFEYDPKAVCKKWDKFLQRVLPEEGDRLMLEEFMGYCLLPTHEYEHFLYMYGASGANGKSVIIEVMRNFFSPENVSSLDLAEFEGHNLEGLVNKLVNMGSEVNSKRDLSAQLAVLKKLVSPYDTIAIDPKFEKQFVLYPHEKPKCIFAGNKKISYDADDGGVLRRILLLTFSQTIKEDEMIRDLPDRLLDESAGILNRLLQGIDRLTQNNGFTMSDARKEQLEEFKKEINPIRAYVLDNIKQTPGMVVPKELVYLHYREWCSKEGRKPAPANIFWKEFKSVYDFDTKRPHANSVFSHAVWGDRPSFIVGFSILGNKVEKIRHKEKDLIISANHFTEIGFSPVTVDE